MCVVVNNRGMSSEELDGRSTELQRGITVQYSVVLYQVQYSCSSYATVLVLLEMPVTALLSTAVPAGGCVPW